MHPIRSPLNPTPRPNHATATTKYAPEPASFLSHSVCHSPSPPLQSFQIPKIPNQSALKSIASMDSGKPYHAGQPLPHPQQPPEGPWPTWVMGVPAPPLPAQPATTHVPINYVMHKNSAYPAPPVTAVSPHASSSPYPYVQATPVPGSAGKSPLEMILKMFERCGKKLEENTRKAGTAAGNCWNHLKTSPNVADAAMTRLVQGTKVLAEGGHDKIFQQNFGTLPGEKLKKAYACYLSTSSGPVIGTIYITTGRVAFCSDNPLCRNIAPGQQEWIYYKVVIPLDQLKVVNPSSSRTNPAEKYIQIVTTDDHEFWFMGFVSYEKALNNLMEAFQHSGTHRPRNLHF